MNKPRVFLLVAGLVMTAALLTGCYMPVAPDVTPTPSQMQQVEEGMDQLEIEAAIYNVTMTARAAAYTPTPEPTPTATEEPTVVVTEEPTPEPTVEVVVTPVQTPEVQPSPVVSGGETSYTVRPGDTLFSIARRYGLTFEEVAAFNGITNPNLIQPGQVIRIPAGGTSIPTPQPGGERTHVVQPGENLFRIALRYNMSYLYLASYNGIANPHAIYVGQVIRIPPSP